MRHIEIVFKQNGFVVRYEGMMKNNGDYVYKATEEKKMLEEIGLAILDKKIEVIDK